MSDSTDHPGDSAADPAPSVGRTRRGPRRTGPHPDISPEAVEIARAWCAAWDALSPEEQERRTDRLTRDIRAAG